jgi:hypothetical protein
MYNNVIQNNMKKEKSVVIRIDNELYNFLKSLELLNKTSVSHEVRKLIVEKYNESISNK